MNTDELKALIGKECLVIDALSKRGLKRTRNNCWSNFENTTTECTYW